MRNDYAKAARRLDSKLRLDVWKYTPFWYGFGGFDWGAFYKDIGATRRCDFYSVQDGGPRLLALLFLAEVAKDGR